MSVRGLRPGALARRPGGELAPRPVRELPVRSADLFDGFSPDRTVELEIRHGNGDLIRAVDILGIGGPFRRTSPWELEDERGRRLINAGGYAALPFGESYPPLVEFVRQYLEADAGMALPQQSASEWRAAVEANLVALLAAEAPSHADSQVFFSNSGAEAIEAALKFARRARPKAKILLNFRGAYHGKTYGALSLTPNLEFQEPFRPLLPHVKTLPYGDAEALERAIYAEGPDRICAIVVEPVLGEGGVVVPPPEFLPAIARLAERYGIVTIADEIQTGLGRSGHWFASTAGGLEPDIVTLAKPLGGGLVPVGATIARRRIVQRSLGGLDAKRHSNTFGGGSLAMAVAQKSLEILWDENLVERSRTMGEQGLKRLQAIRDRYPGFILEVRGAGMLFAIQFRHVLKPFLVPGQEELVRQLGSGLALRALHLAGVHVCYSLNASRVLRLTPALTMPEELFAEMFARVERVARTHRNAWAMLPRTPLPRLLRLARLALGTR